MTINKYQNGKIYKVVDIGYIKSYIGSTIEDLNKRMAKHRNCDKNFSEEDKKIYTTTFIIFDEYGIANCKIELIEYFPCKNKEELNKREGEHIRNNDCVNRCIPGRTKQEWREEHKDEAK